MTVKLEPMLVYRSPDGIDSIPILELTTMCDRCRARQAWVVSPIVAEPPITAEQILFRQAGVAGWTLEPRSVCATCEELDG
mgnify:CR=1 FL=1